ncbi:hypothetical protein D3OALGA1CA_909 [Olavius algarvensis associated proteobacterium Delta 3]|nr:hypothetical protein D3OALGA1CA_909 [Olavius algarvensis associated proteobacterium Delta 3]CAB5129114.1 hypothetical protein D3OALGB2SA_3496 [Olavius algarvensis associated proteobacterium Delta 3]
MVPPIHTSEIIKGDTRTLLKQYVMVANCGHIPERGEGRTPE